ncbi:DUF4847 family protein [Bacteroides sp. OttesenSCG-928-D19]|nr:DUF4847 family protein [Bacteroides sp. OttesenSCG-928-D19]
MRKTIKTKYLFTIALLLIGTATGCDQADDVTGIFTEKTWKLTNIYLDDNSFPPELSRDYWDNEAAQVQSYKRLNDKGTFTIRFEGFETDNQISGSYTGYATSTNISGNWNANGKSNKFETDQESKVDKDPLGVAFINALKTAYKYEGNYDDLQIFFMEGKRKKYLLMRIEATDE